VKQLDALTLLRRQSIEPEPLRRDLERAMRHVRG
jgi:hypothetical protein